jgi:hypothetical protein
MICCTAALQHLQLNPNSWVTEPGVPQRPRYGAAVTRLFRHGPAGYFCMFKILERFINIQCSMSKIYFLRIIHAMYKYAGM